MKILNKLFGNGNRPPKRSKNDIYALFQNMENEGVFIHQEFLWTFFYDSESKSELEILVVALKALGFQGFEFEHNEAVFTLKADLIKEFTEDSFYIFYLKCYELGRSQNLKHYGDFEVGNRNSSLPLEKDDKFPGINWIIKKPKVDGLPRIDVINGAFLNFKYKNEFPYGFYVTIYFESDNKSKLPNKEQEAEFERFEVKLKKLLRQYCGAYWIYRMTWDEDRTNYFQVNDTSQAQKAVDKLQQEYSELVEIHTNTEFDPDWKQATEMITY